MIRSALVSRAEEFPTKSTLLTRVSDEEVIAPANWHTAHLTDQTGAVGAGLLELVGAGETVAVSLDQTADRIAVQLGAACAGMRVVDTDRGLTKEALTKILSEQNVSVLVVSPEDLQIVYEVMPELAQISQTTSEPLNIAQFPKLKYVLQNGLRPQKGTYRLRDSLVYYPMNSGMDELSKKDCPFFVAANSSTGAVTLELTQQAALDAAAKKAKEVKIQSDSRVLFKANKDIGVNLCVGALACVLNNALLVVPGEKHDEKMIAAAKEKDECDVALA
eukprot:CAMPEP_0184528224 /NCGR_PEP_ID=MMETSP0198_2-20121128/11675_1 /TAXON_ID=1112570 /ORGANISM="Thraustochytrium sp., Strain LLF1b" /LENGTH=275 /DNA_ID=CAMNT_0026920051 /DNA_START=229 /DNA_END=1053 /DNA_ORIENTATION=+